MKDLKGLLAYDNLIPIELHIYKYNIAEVFWRVYFIMNICIEVAQSMQWRS